MVNPKERCQYNAKNEWLKEYSTRHDRQGYYEFCCCGRREPWNTNWIYHTVHVWRGERIIGEVWCQDCCIKRGLIW